MLLEGAIPELANGYREAFLTAGGDFNAAFPIPDAMLPALARATNSTVAIPPLRQP
jgi:hypothetical protein